MRSVARWQPEPADVSCGASNPAARCREPSKRRFVVDQDPLAFCQDCLIGGVPRDPESSCDPSNGQMLHHDAFERTPQPATRERGPRLG
jgi:hypothetical protein